MTNYSTLTKLTLGNIFSRKYFFSSRIIKPWNSLPGEIVTAANSKLFKSLISKQDLNKYLTFPCLICK